MLHPHDGGLEVSVPKVKTWRVVGLDNHPRDKTNEPFWFEETVGIGEVISITPRDVRVNHVSVISLTNSDPDSRVPHPWESLDHRLWTGFRIEEVKE